MVTGNPWLLVPLVLAVDVSMVGYLANPRVGAVTYNALHSWLPGLGAILVAHVGMDRLLGYGLKYPTSFADTHLGRIGRSRAER